jgi:hypothetical protein
MVFNKGLEISRYSRAVPLGEIKGNDFNLNLPRYIDREEAEDIQGIEGHLRGGIPAVDIDALGRYWKVCPQLRQTLFKDNRPGYLDLQVEKSAVKRTIYEHAEFTALQLHEPEATKPYAAESKPDRQTGASRQSLTLEAGHCSGRQASGMPNLRSIDEKGVCWKYSKPMELDLNFSGDNTKISCHYYSYR